MCRSVGNEVVMIFRILNYWYSTYSIWYLGKQCHSCNHRYTTDTVLIFDCVIKSWFGPFLPLHHKFNVMIRKVRKIYKLGGIKFRCIGRFWTGFCLHNCRKPETEASQENSANIDIYFYTCASPTVTCQWKAHWVSCLFRLACSVWPRTVILNLNICIACSARWLLLGKEKMTCK